MIEKESIKHPPKIAKVAKKGKEVKAVIKGFQKLYKKILK